MIPGFGRSGRGHGNPLQYSCLENPHGHRSLAGYSPRDHKELDMTERLSAQSLSSYQFLDLHSAILSTYMYTIAKHLKQIKGSLTVEGITNYNMECSHSKLNEPQVYAKIIINLTDMLNERSQKQINTLLSMLSHSRRNN